MSNLIKTQYLFLLLVIAFPDLVIAGDGFVTCSGPDCTACSLIQSINRIVIWIISSIGLIAMLVFAYAGFLMLTAAGDSGQVERAKKAMTNVIIGIVITLAAWLVVDTVMKGLVRNNGQTQLGPWNAITCTPQRVTATPTPTVAPDGTLTPTDGTVLSEAEARALLASRLASGEITIDSTDSCSDRTISTCTSLEGVRTTTINRVLALQSEVGAPIVITGGTEVGHQTGRPCTHENGCKVDLRVTPELNDYIVNNYTALGGNKWRDPHGNIYFRHGPVDHWDVSVAR